MMVIADIYDLCRRIIAILKIVLRTVQRTFIFYRLIVLIQFWRDLSPERQEMAPRLGNSS